MITLRLNSKVIARLQQLWFHTWLQPQGYIKVSAITGFNRFSVSHAFTVALNYYDLRLLRLYEII